MINGAVCVHDDVDVIKDDRWLWLRAQRTVEQIEGGLEEIRRKEQAKRTMRSSRDLDSVARVAVERNFKPAWVHKRMQVIGKPVSYNAAMAAYVDARSAR